MRNGVYVLCNEHGEAADEVQSEPLRPGLVLYLGQLILISEALGKHEVG